LAYVYAMLAHRHVQECSACRPSWGSSDGHRIHVRDNQWLRVVLVYSQCFSCQLVGEAGNQCIASLACAQVAAYVLRGFTVGNGTLDCLENSIGSSVECFIACLAAVPGQQHSSEIT